MKAVGLQTFIWENNFKSLGLMIVFPLILSLEIYLIFFALVAYSVEDANPIAITNNIFPYFFPLILLGVAFWFFIAFFIHKKLTLSMSHALPIDRNVNPRIYNLVENLCISRGLPVPSLYMIPDDSLNAFAAGWSPKSSVIAFSKGILERLDDKEIEAVAAHELTHIMNRDIRLMAIAIIFVGIITTLAEIFIRVRFHGGSDKKNGAGIIILVQILVFVLGYLISIIVQLAISRKREFLADAGSVELTKNPDGLITALQKISSDPTIEGINNRQMAQICIENPLAELNRKSFLDKIFSSHPPIADRINALKLMGGVQG